MSSFWPALESEPANHLPRELSRSFLVSFCIPINAVWLVVTPTYLLNASAGRLTTRMRTERPVREVDVDAETGSRSR